MKRAALALALTASAVGADAVLHTSYPAKLVRVIDADTQKMQVQIWPGITSLVNVRVLGIDTPETRRPNKKCKQAERALGREATTFVAKLYSNSARSGGSIRLVDVGSDKYFGRVTARVLIGQDKDRTFVDLAQVLIKEALAIPYDGGKKANWCNLIFRD